ncbi:hypothetical protein MNBD_ALPHA04-584 [hydrothermal vent metagenome]|uniref:Uncharacterized protein n=1 Tax=hydrothermal vent metagenome TaxID=652676 RepID=A0A3B0S1X9_9ZZZZ
MNIHAHDAFPGRGREIVDWNAGSPVYRGEEIEIVRAPALRGPWLWPLKPGDLVCDWLNVTAPDNRGLLRMLINLTLYSKVVALVVVFAT